ncbi:hypothetical protein AOXY_G6907 [Acipenser oxyrinchus oxyrinchus]|uniref:Centromere protein H C-terminal domain-containing protein n=1 Tax=Acipenser oxyrinchus oxyrinchus TaxID=40147 RepID=A0AAD8LN45_ACIOX|nr:hypothetical protein AOXY_G6907 [Acipenser oxyrinchus oxyrinchus]
MSGRKPQGKGQHVRREIRGVNPFPRLKEVSFKLKEVALNCQVPLQKEAKKPEQPLTELVCVREQMKQHFLEMKTSITLRDPTFACEMSDRSLNVSLETFETPYEEVLYTIRNKDLAIHRMQCARAVSRQMQINADDRRQLMNSTIDLCKTIESIQNVSSCVCLFVLELKVELRARMKEVQTQAQLNEQVQQFSAGTEDAGRAHLEQHSNVLVLIQEVFRRVILGAGVHWAEDPKLLHVVLCMKDASFL